MTCTNHDYTINELVHEVKKTRSTFTINQTVKMQGRSHSVKSSLTCVRESQPKTMIECNDEITMQADYSCPRHNDRQDEYESRHSLLYCFLSINVNNVTILRGSDLTSTKQNATDALKCSQTISSLSTCIVFLSIQEFRRDEVYRKPFSSFLIRRFFTVI